MLKESIQYINGIKTTKNIDIDNKIVKDGELIEHNHSSFTLYDSSMPNDALSKIKLLQKSHSKNYIATIVVSSGDLVIKKDEIINRDIYSLAMLDNDYNIAVKKNDIFEVKHFFDKSGLDGIFSPFQLLNQYNQSHNIQNGLTIYAYENNLYMLIIDKKKIQYSRLIHLDQLSMVDECDFYDDDVSKQLSWAQLYYLELYNAISLILSRYYDTKDDATFIDHINIIYDDKILSNQQIEELSSELFMRIDYIKVDVSELLFDLAIESPEFLHSLIPPRKESSTKKIILWGSLFIATILVVVFLIGFLKEETKDTLPQISSELTIVDSSKINRNIKRLIFQHFDLLPIEVVLESFSIDDDSSSFVLSMFDKKIYFDKIRPNILKVYKNSSAKFTKIDDEYKVHITNTNLINKAIIPLKKYDQSIKNLQQIEVKKLIKDMMPFDTIISFDSKKQYNDIIKYRYHINIIVKSPDKFFKIMKAMDRSKYNLNVSYPISFESSSDELEINFMVEFTQKIK